MYGKLTVTSIVSTSLANIYFSNFDCCFAIVADKIDNNKLINEIEKNVSEIQKLCLSVLLYSFILRVSRMYLVV